MTLRLPHRAASLCALAAAAAVLAGGTAYAAWSTTGSGSGSGTASHGLTAFHTTAVVAQGAKLYPGGSAPLTLNIDNTDNNYTLKVTAVALDTQRSVTGCTTPAVTISAGSWAGVTVAPNSTSGPITVPGAVSMGLAASSNCQGATLTIPVTLTGHN